MTTTLNSLPAGIGADGVITSLFAGHGTPCSAASSPTGAQAGGFGLVALTGFEFDAAWASGSGSSWPFGSPGYVGCLNVNVAGRPLTVTDCTVRSGPGVVVLVTSFVRSKSRLKSVRHCVARCWRSTCVPARKRFDGAS